MTLKEKHIKFWNAIIKTLKTGDFDDNIYDFTDLKEEVWCKVFNRTKETMPHGICYACEEADIREHKYEDYRSNCYYCPIIKRCNECIAPNSTYYLLGRTFEEGNYDIDDIVGMCEVIRDSWEE